MPPGKLPGFSGPRRFQRHTRFGLLVALSLLATQAWAVDFVVQLTNGLSDEPLAEQRIDVRRRLADGASEWVTKAYTDIDGSAGLSLDDGVYFFQARPYDQRVVSADFSHSATVALQAGLLPITAISGVSGAPLANISVNLQRLDEDGKFRWFSGGKTDETGSLVFEPTGLNDGEIYRLTTKSPTDGNWLHSDAITSAGPMTFTVGNQPLTITLTNAISGEPLTDVKLVARERLADGSSRWMARTDTDANGQAVFDLDGLGDDRVYFIIAYAYHNLPVTSADLTETGELGMQAGSVPVTLVDGDSGQTLSGIRVVAREQKADGSLTTQAGARTDEQGVVHFDLPGLADGKPYTFKVQDVYGENKIKYSPWVTTPRPTPSRFPRPKTKFSTTSRRRWPSPRRLPIPGSRPAASRSRAPPKTISASPA